MLELKDFEAAYNKVQEVVLPTKLIKSDYFSEQTGNDVYLKPENMQLTGAYKIRGAYYKISTLSEEEKAKGLITASAGNHAQGVALAAARQGVKATIVMPTTTPLLKVNRTKDLGAEVILHGDVYDEACAHALDLAAEHGYTFVHPFDDPTVATGQGTIAMDIFKELPTVDLHSCTNRWRWTCNRCINTCQVIKSKDQSHWSRTSRSSLYESFFRSRKSCIM